MLRVAVLAALAQALRMAVNDELGSLSRLLQTMPGVLAPGARVAAISFHAHEYNLVKRAFRGWRRQVLARPDPSSLPSPARSRLHAVRSRVAGSAARSAQEGAQDCSERGGEQPARTLRPPPFRRAQGTDRGKLRLRGRCKCLRFGKQCRQIGALHFSFLLLTNRAATLPSIPSPETSPA